MLLADSTTANTIDSAANETVADCLNRFREDDVSNERGYRINEKRRVLYLENRKYDET